VDGALCGVQRKRASRECQERLEPIVECLSQLGPSGQRLRQSFRGYKRFTVVRLAPFGATLDARCLRWLFAMGFCLDTFRRERHAFGEALQALSVHALHVFRFDFDWILYPFE